MASWLVRSSPDRVVQGRVLAGDIVLCSWERHFTLTVPLSTQVYKWVPANLMLGIAACLRALTILYLATNSCHLPHLCHFQRSPKVLFFRVGYSPWSFVTSTEPGFNTCLPCQVNLVNTNLALLRPRFSVALWSKRGSTTLLIPRHDPPSDIAICMDINPNPGPSSVQDSLNPSRLAETHLHVTSQCGQSLSYSRRELLRLRHLAKTTSMSQSTYQMLKSL